MAAIADDDSVLTKKPEEIRKCRPCIPSLPIPRRCKIALNVVLVAAAAAYVIWLVQFFIDETKVARFSVDLAGFEGLNATAVGGGGARTAVVSPEFSLAAVVENPRALAPWCAAGGRAVVSYGGVSLAWGRVPAFCAPTMGAAELAVAAKGSGVGLSEDQRRRFVAEWDAGTARVAAEMRLVYDANGFSGTCAYQGVSIVRRELALLPGQGAPAPSQSGAKISKS